MGTFELYDWLCCLLTDYEQIDEDTSLDYRLSLLDDLYTFGVQLQNSWEEIIASDS